MAVIKYFPRPYRIGGHRGSVVFTANFSGNIVRNRVRPIRRTTPRNTTIRATFRSIVQRWRILTPGEQLTFYEKKDQYLKAFPNGKIHSPEGPQLQGEFNIPLSVNDSPLVNEAFDKLVFPVRSIFLYILTAAPFNIVLFLNDNSIPSNYVFKFYASGRRNISPSLSFPNDFTLIKTFDVSEPFSYSLTNAYIDIFGPGTGVPPTPPEGIYIEVALSMVNIPTGQQQLMDRKILSSI